MIFIDLYRFLCLSTPAAQTHPDPQDGVVDFPELRRCIALKAAEANGRRAELQELACFAGIAMKFQEALMAGVGWWLLQWLLTWWFGCLFSIEGCGSFSGPKREFGLVERVETVIKTVMKGTKVEGGQRNLRQEMAWDKSPNSDQFAVRSRAKWPNVWVTPSWCRLCGCRVVDGVAIPLKIVIFPCYVSSPEVIWNDKSLKLGLAERRRWEVGPRFACPSPVKACNTPATVRGVHLSRPLDQGTETIHALFVTRVCLKMGYIPNEIAI